MNDPAAKTIDSNLFIDFARYFELKLALTEEQRAQVFQVRYRVYCEEFGYEPAEVFRDEQERDAYDEQSAHCLVVHKESGMPAGCVRLVTVTGDQPLPMEEHAAGSIDAAFMAPYAQKRSSICEISRLAVDGAFRRRRGEQETRFGTPDALVFSSQEKRTFPLLALSLFIASAASADLLGRRNLFAIMEPFLPAILRRSGVRFQRIGEDFEFRGIRAPYFASIDALRHEVPPEISFAYDVVRQQLFEQLNEAREALGEGAAGGVIEPAVELFDGHPHLTAVS